MIAKFLFLLYHTRFILTGIVCDIKLLIVLVTRALLWESGCEGVAGWEGDWILS